MEIKTMNDNNESKDLKKGFLEPLGLALETAQRYVVLFVVIMLAMDKVITQGNTLIPAALIYGIVFAVEYFIVKKEDTPQWLAIGSFFLPITTAVVIAIIS